METQQAAKSANTKATLGGGVGVAASQILIWLGTQNSWFTFTSDDEKAVIAGAFAVLIGTVASFAMRWVK